MKRKQTKTWKTIATYDSYEKALEKKKNFLKESKEAYEVKIKRSNINGGIFRVKVYKVDDKK